MAKKVSYKRVLLKLSGEILAGPDKFGLSHDACQATAKAIQALQKLGVQVAVVIGGGNIFRGVNLKELGIPRTPADQMGMLATLMNGIALQEALLAIGTHARLMSALECPQVAEPYNWRNAQYVLDKGDVLLFVGGTGNAYFTTDTAAALRASEIHADVLLKATKVDGVYSKDPLKDPKAHFYRELDSSQFLAEKLGVMDATSIALCMSNQIPILVFNMQLLLKKQMSTVLTHAHGTLIKSH